MWKESKALSRMNWKNKVERFGATPFGLKASLKLRPDTSDFALRATTGHVDPTRRVQRSGLKKADSADSNFAKLVFEFLLNFDYKASLGCIRMQLYNWNYGDY